MLQFWLTTAVAVAGVVVSIVAIIRSRNAERAAQRSADAAEDTARIDRQRWHEDHTPTFSVWYEFYPNATPRRSVINVKKVGGDDCACELRLETPAGSATVFTPYSWDPVSIGMFRTGDRYEIAGPERDPNRGDMIIRCDCVGADGAEWTVRTLIEFDFLY
jgi:hypothetical protein